MIINDVLKGIVKVVQVIHTQVELAKTNKAECKTLIERVAVVVAAVRKLETLTEVDHYLPALKVLLSCLNDCAQFIQNDAQNQSWFKQVLKAKAVKERFNSLNEQLQKVIGELNVGLSVQMILNREQDRAAETLESIFIRQHQETLLKLNEEALKKLRQLEDKQGQLYDILTQQLGSIRRRLNELTEENKFISYPSHLRLPLFELTVVNKLAKNTCESVYMEPIEEAKAQVMDI